MGKRDGRAARGSRAVAPLVEQLLAATAVPPVTATSSEAAPSPTDWEAHLFIRHLTERIAAQEGGGPTADSVPESHRKRLQAVDRFMRWLTDNGVNTDGIEISEFPGYDLGLKAKKSFNEGETVVNIPRKMIMSEEYAKNSSLGPFIEKHPILQLMSNITLVMYLLLAKFTPDSFWKPYIDILPKSYNTVLYFSFEDLAELKDTPNCKLALKFFQDIARQYAYFYKQLHKSDDPVARTMRKFFTYKEYCWAVSTVTTRLNIVPSESNENIQTTALIPLWDMCNHTNGQVTTNFNVEKNQAECFALSDYKRGDQILIFYGKRTNGFFFLYNGFVYPDNEYDSLTIALGISPNDPLEKLKKQLLEKLSIDSNTVFQITNRNPPLTEELIAFARVFVMDKDNLTYWLEGKCDSLRQFDCVLLKPEIEKKAYSFINMRCKLLLQKYKVSKISEDLSKLQANDESTAHLPKSNDTHRSLIKKLKDTEIKLFEKAIEFTGSKL